VPETFLNLDENVAAQPVEPRTLYRDSLDTARTIDSRTQPSHHEKEHEVEPDSLELRQRVTSARPDSEAYPSNHFRPPSSTDTHNVSDLNNLDELSALPIVPPERLGRVDEEKTEVGTESIWHSSRQKKGSQLATHLYTIAYLVFFSILGTLARLGLQALTFYPGAPVTQGVLWANFGGSLVLGFLVEDRNLFKEEWGRKSRSWESRRLSWWKKDQELIKNSVRYSRTANVGLPFASAHAASLYPVRQVDAMPAVERRSESPPPPSLLSSNKYGDAEEKKRHTKVKKTIPLYIGLSVGFCGSFTSFSSFQRDVYLSLSNSARNPDVSSPTPRNGGYSVLAVLGTLILTPTLCLGALQFGAHIALGLNRWTPTVPFAFTRKILDRVVVLLASLSWIGAVVMVALPPDRPAGPVGPLSWTREHWRGDALFALVFAPLGCLARFYLSLVLNARVPSFPLGTFAVNILGTLLEAAFFDLQHRPLGGASVVGGGRVACQALQGMMDGFCGCLTTVATWVAELNSLRRHHAYNYGGLSLLVGLIAVVVVMGPIRWSSGFAATACGA
jgi:CrcB protein